MKPPKNFYSNLDRRKQGLPEVPAASASDSGKIIKVGSDGSYELGTMPEVPKITMPSHENREIMIGDPDDRFGMISVPVANLQAKIRKGAHSISAYGKNIEAGLLTKYLGAPIEVEYHPESGSNFSLYGTLFRKAGNDYYVIGVGISRTGTEPVRKLIHITYSDLYSSTITVDFTDLPFDSGAEATP